MAHEFDTDTLDDIKQRDVFNLETILNKKGRTKKHFPDSMDANKFVGTRLQQILSYLGVPLESRDAELVELRMQTGNITVENRVYNEPDDEWRSGIYVYKDNEIAGFVGYPIYNADAPALGLDVLCTEKI